MGYTVAPPPISDEDIAKGADEALKDGAWKKSDDGYTQKGADNAVSKKDFHKAMKAQLEAEGVKKRTKKIAKKAKELLSEGQWKSAEKNGKTYYYNKNNKSEVIWDLEEYVGKEMGYVSKKEKKDKEDKKEKKEKKDKDEKKEKEDKKEKKEKKSEKDDDKQDKKEKKDKKEDKEKDDKKEKKEKKDRKATDDKDDPASEKEKSPKKDKKDKREDKEKDDKKDKKSDKDDDKKDKKAKKGAREESQATEATTATTAATTTTTTVTESGTSSPTKVDGDGDDGETSAASPTQTEGGPETTDVGSTTPATETATPTAATDAPPTTTVDSTPQTTMTRGESTAVTPPTLTQGGATSTQETPTATAEGDEDETTEATTPHQIPTESLLGLLPEKPVMKRGDGGVVGEEDREAAERQRQAAREAAAREAERQRLDEEAEARIREMREREERVRDEEARLLREREERERAEELLRLQEQQRVQMRQERDVLVASEASVRSAVVEHSAWVERLELDEWFARYFVQYQAASLLEDAVSGLATSALLALQQQLRNEVAHEAVLAYAQLEQCEIVSRAHYFRLQLERELSERMILAEIETEDRMRYTEEEDLCRDALLIVERRHHMWLHEVMQLVHAWVDFTRSKFGEFFVESVETLNAWKALEQQHRRALEDVAARTRDCLTCEGMARREIDIEWERERSDSAREFEQHLLRCAEEARRVMTLPRTSTEKQLDLIRRQIDQLRSGGGNRDAMKTLQATSKQCEVARITARINALEDDSMRHRSTLAAMRLRNPHATSAAGVGSGGGGGGGGNGLPTAAVDAANATLNSIRLQIESIQSLQTHQAIAAPAQTFTQAADTYHHLLHSFYARHDASKIPTIPQILQQFAGREDALFGALVRKYHIATGSPYRDSLVSILSRAAPWQLPCVDIILHLYEGAEYDLIEHLMQTYQ